MAIIFNSLKEPFDNIALLIELGVEIVLELEIDFVGNTNESSLSLKVRTNKFRRVSFVCENFFTLELNTFKKFTNSTQGL